MYKDNYTHDYEFNGGNLTIKHRNTKLTDFTPEVDIVKTDDAKTNTVKSDTIETLRKKLLIFISCIPSARQKSKTTIQKLNFFAQFEEDLLPYFPKTANHFGSYSSDIEYLLNDLVNNGQLETGTYKINHWIVDKFSAEREINTYRIPLDVQEKIRVWAKELNIDYPDYRIKVSSFCESYQYDAKILGDLSKKKFLETINQRLNHLFFDISYIDEKLKEKLKLKGIDIIGLESILKLPFPIILRSERKPAEIVSGIATGIINKKETLYPYHFSIRSIHTNFSKNGKINLLGEPVFLVGYFVNFSTHNNGTIAKFRDSTVIPQQHEIEVFIGKYGEFCHYRSIDDIKTNECIVVGIIDEKEGEPIIRTIGIIRIDSLSDDFIRNIRNEHT